MKYLKIKKKGLKLYKKEYPLSKVRIIEKEIQNKKTSEKNQ